jgi:hypothetical protein
MTSLLNPPQPGHAVAVGTQSATHSSTLPTISKTPQLDLQLLREPVAVGGMLHTLASYVSTHSVPTATESAGHFLAWAGTAHVAISATTNTPTASDTCFM